MGNKKRNKSVKKEVKADTGEVKSESVTESKAEQMDKEIPLSEQKVEKTEMAKDEMIGAGAQVTIEEPKKESPVKIEVPAKEADNAEKETTPIKFGNFGGDAKEPEKRQRVRPTGIMAFKTNPNEKQEIESPMKKKKGELRKLNTLKSFDENSEKFKNFEPLLADVMKNFDNYSKQFDVLKNKSMAELQVMHNKGELKNVRNEVRKSLEIKLPEGSEDAQNLHDFQQLKKEDFKKIEELIHTYDDWLEEITNEMEDAPASVKNVVPPLNTQSVSADEQKKVMRHQSSKILEIAQHEAQQKLRAQLQVEELAKQQQAKRQAVEKAKDNAENEKLFSQLESLKDDDDLMKELDEIQKMEEKELEEKRAKFTPRGDAQGQGDQKGADQDDDEKLPKSGGGGYYSLFVIGAAIAIAGVAIAYKNFKK